MGACVGRACPWGPPHHWAILGAFDPRAMCPNQGYVHDILISRSSSEGTDESVDRPRTQGEAALCGITRATSANEDGDGPQKGPSGFPMQLDKGFKLH